MKKPRVAFICVHNSCRSQMAEAISKIIAPEAFEPFSAGTEIKTAINAQAVATIKEMYGYDMTMDQKPKTIAELPPIDIVVTMGCQVECPYLPCRHREDWGLDDPTGKSDETFTLLARVIEAKINDLAARLNNL